MNTPGTYALSAKSTVTRRRLVQMGLGVGVLAGLRKRSLAESVSVGRRRFAMLPLGAVKPTGWLLEQLRIQARGLSGHLGETWKDVGPESGWLGGNGESWERGPYYLDGLIPLAYLLDDDSLKEKAKPFIEWTLQGQQANGMFGPKSNNDWWPRMVMLKALSQYQEATGDPRVIPFMTRYFAFQLQELPRRPLRNWGKFRWQDELLVVLWLHERTGNPALIQLARLLHEQGHDWIGQFADFQYQEPVTRDVLKRDGTDLNEMSLSTHGVNNGQGLKTGAVWSLVSGSVTDQQATAGMLETLDEYHGLPNGMFSCDEHFAGRSPSHGSELCTVAEMMFSLEQALSITGDPSFGDRLEKLAYNALPGTFTDDMWAHQYNQQPNQIECALLSKPWTTDGPESNLFGLAPHFGCCTANFNQAWPKFASSLIMQAEDGIAVCAFAPCTAKINVQGIEVGIEVSTRYPFEETVKMRITSGKDLLFSLHTRIPAWAEGAEVAVNGKRGTPTPKQGDFYQIRRRWSQGDIIEFRFPQNVRTVHGYRNSVSVEKGPVVFSYDIGEQWTKLRDRGLTADWSVYPTRPWNYALVLSESASITEEKRSSSKGGIFTKEGTPLHLLAKARHLPSWTSLDGVADTPPQSPLSTDSALEQVTLVPYAASKLRITAFPWSTS